MRWEKAFISSLFRALKSLSLQKLLVYLLLFILGYLQRCLASLILTTNVSSSVPISNFVQVTSLMRFLDDPSTLMVGPTFPGHQFKSGLSSPHLSLLLLFLFFLCTHTNRIFFRPLLLSVDIARVNNSQDFIPCVDEPVPGTRLRSGMSRNSH